MSTPEITQRDLQSRSREIMDAVERGDSFIVTRDGYAIGELIPLRRRRKFVSRQEFAAMSRNAHVSDLDAFRADQDAVADYEEGDPYERLTTGPFPAGTTRHRLATELIMADGVHGETYTAFGAEMRPA